uniref:Helicase C-terminal domain-containing protein n=1 Tax=Timema tahoe TaxID=61484 RepID=A0A7R9FFN2_9NEOP|nr:unnamed protein product [Timema tahoe]
MSNGPTTRPQNTTQHFHFDGRGHEDLTTFTQRCELQSRTARVDPLEWVPTIKRQLKDTATQWWKLYEEYIMTWEEFKQRLMHHFASTTIIASLHAELYGKEQTQTEPSRYSYDTSFRILMHLTTPTIKESLLILTQCVVLQVDWLTEKMREANFTVSSMHGDMPQKERDTIMKEFRSGTSKEDKPSCTFTTESMATAFHRIQEGLQMLADEDPDVERSARVHRTVMEGLTCYQEIYKEKKRAAKQPTIHTFFQPVAAMVTHVGDKIMSDVWARGIDVQQVSLVINYDLPNNRELYIHRIGRSGRFGRKGVAINFVKSDDIRILRDIEQYYSTQIDEMPMNGMSLTIALQNHINLNIGCTLKI